MAFKIIRNDITKVTTDIIVNTANPNPVFNNGTDRAVYEAAGKVELLKERKKIGTINCGEVAVTSAYQLDAKYIIHTVGPVWVDGCHGEFEVLEHCYTNSLEKAVELGCESIAFPLISTGVYGFPKDKALQIAIAVFSRFLLENEMQIILVVFDTTSFQLSGKIVGDVDSYIDTNYVIHKRNHENARYSEGNSTILRGIELEHIGASFHDKLFELIEKSDVENKDVWKLANLDRKHFSKIQCDVNCHPKKRTVMALCIALKLDLNQSKDLLARADWAFSPSNKMDLIVQKAILDKQYDIFQVNMVLFKYTNETLGI